MLILFDIDGTLLVTRHAGIHAMADAMEELYGRDATMDGVEVSGRLDPLIWADTMRCNGLPTGAARHDEFRQRYADRLAQRFRIENTAMSLPGVATLVEALAALDDVTVGVLTGNYQETGLLKIEYAGLQAEHFTVRAWGDDAETRRALPPVAMDRYEELTGRPRDPSRTVIIGDTPHDIDCAAANGCRSIAVGTGGFTREELASHDPDHVVEDLSDTAGILDWIGG